MNTTTINGAAPRIDPVEMPGWPVPEAPPEPERDIIPPGEEETLRRVRLTPASQVRMRPVSWLWDERIPAGMVTIIPGREGIGKSLLLAWLTAQITRGTLPGRLHGTPRPVVYAATEDSWAHTIAPRLAAAGADLDLVYRVEVEHDGAIDQLTLPRDTTALADEITRLGAAMLAADPLLSLIHSSIDTHRDRDLRTALEPLARLADTTHAAVVGLAHFNKSASGDALNLITGSRAFSAVARAVIAVAHDPDAGDGSCVMSQAKNNLGPTTVPSLRYQVHTATVPTDEGPAHVGRLEFTGESDRSVADILTETGEHGIDRAERDQTAAWLTDYLTHHGGEAARADVLKAARADGIPERTLQRAARRAGIAIERTGFPARTMWRLTLADDPTPPVAPQPRHFPRTGATGATGATGGTGQISTLTPTPQPPDHNHPDSTDLGSTARITRQL